MQCSTLNFIFSIIFTRYRYIYDTRKVFSKNILFIQTFCLSMKYIKPNYGAYQLIKLK